MSYRIGVIRGGVSDEYPISLKTGATILQALREEGYDTIDILLDKDGMLHIKGIPATVADLHGKVDVVWNALHGNFGEDGKFQQLFDGAGILYTGSGALASAFAHNKELAKERARALELYTPQTLLINPAEESDSIAEIASRIYRTMSPPWVVKPLTGGASINTFVVHTALELAQVIDDAMARGELFLIEQYIYGREASVGVIDGFRGQDHYIAPVVEIKKPSRSILTHDRRMSDDPVFAIGGSFRSDERDMLARSALALHQALGASDFSQSEFIIDPRGKIYFLETDTNPILTENSPLPFSLRSVGSGMRELVSHVIGKKTGK